MLTKNQMKQAYLARRTNELAESDFTSGEAWIRSLYDAECNKMQIQSAVEEYRAGMEILKNHVVIAHGSRTTVYPEAGDNQIVVDAGHIATSPAWRLVSVNPR